MRYLFKMGCGFLKFSDWFCGGGGVCLDSDVLIFLGREYLFIRWLCSFLFGG